MDALRVEGAFLENRACRLRLFGSYSLLSARRKCCWPRLASSSTNALPEEPQLAPTRWRCAAASGRWHDESAVSAGEPSQGSEKAQVMGRPQVLVGLRSNASVDPQGGTSASGDEGEPGGSQVCSIDKR